MNRREFMQNGVAGISTATLGGEFLVGLEHSTAGPAGSPEFMRGMVDPPDAFVSCTRRYGLDTNLIPFHAMPPDNFDVQQYVKSFSMANVQAIYHTVVDCWGYSLYNTKVGYKSPRFTIDLLEEVIREAQKYGLKICIYYCFGWQDAVVENHPGWSRVDAEGKPILVDWSSANIKKWGWPCVNSPFKPYVLDQMTELSRDYAIDILFLDMLYQDDPGKPGCYCEYCRKAYRDRFGKDLPTQADWSAEWKQQLTWRVDIMESVWEEIIATLHHYKRGLPVTRNYFELWSRIDRARLVKDEKYINAEDGSADSTATSAIATMARGLTGRKAFYFTMATDFKGVQDWPSWYRYKFKVMNHLSQGAVSLFGDSRTGFLMDGKVEVENFKMLGEAFAEFAQKEKYIQGTTSLPYVGIVFSEYTRLYYAENQIADRFSMSVEGAVSALLTMHVPVNSVPDWDIEKGEFNGDAILILPNMAAMSKKQADELRAFVHNGGLLFGSFETSLYDESGNRLPDYQLADVFGLKYLGRSDEEPGVVHHRLESYLHWRDTELFRGLPQGSLRVMGPYVQTERTSGDTLCYQYDPARMVFGGERVLWGDLPGQETPYPAVHINRYGQGKAVFATSEIFKQCSRLAAVWAFDTPESCDPRRFWWVQKLVENALGLLNRMPPICIKAPQCVEATFWRNAADNSTVVQLFNKAQLDTVIPIENAKVCVQKKAFSLNQAFLPWPNRRDLELRENNGTIEITLPKLGLHEIVILRGQQV